MYAAVAPLTLGQGQHDAPEPFRNHTNVLTQRNDTVQKSVA